MSEPTFITEEESAFPKGFSFKDMELHKLNCRDLKRSHRGENYEFALVENFLAMGDPEICATIRIMPCLEATRKN